MSARHQARRRAVFRNRSLAGLAAVFIAPCLLIGVTVLPGPGQHGAFVGGAVISALAWLLWVLGWWTKVVVSPDGVVIDNVIVRHVIPAGQFDAFVLDSGTWVQAYRTHVKIPWWPLPALLILIEGAILIGHHTL